MGYISRVLGDFDLLQGETRAESFRADQARFGPFDRPMVTTTQPETVNIPGDYATIQAALDDLPIFIDHSFRITVDAGTYNEDLYVPPVIARFIQDGRTTESAGIEIKGDPATPSNVKVNSIYIDSAQGASAVRVRGFEFQGGTPLGDENASVDVAGSQEVNVFDCATVHGDGTGTDGSVGVSAESSGVEVNGFDCGTGLQTGIDCKHGSFFNIVAGTLSGSPQDLYECRPGVIYTGNQPATPTNVVAPDSQMPIYNWESQMMIPSGQSLGTPAWVELLARGSDPGGVPNGSVWFNNYLKVMLGGAARTIPIKTPQAYTANNVTTDRGFDANATTTDELADVLGTLIGDLQQSNIID